MKSKKKNLRPYVLAMMFGLLGIGVTYNVLNSRKNQHNVLALHPTANAQDRSQRQMSNIVSSDNHKNLSARLNDSKSQKPSSLSQETKEDSPKELLQDKTTNILASLWSQARESLLEGDETTAWVHLEKILEHDPFDDDALFKIVEMLESSPRGQLTRDDVREALEMRLNAHPKPIYQVELAMLDRYDGRHQEALTRLQQAAAELHGQFNHVWVLTTLELSHILQRMGKRDESLKLLAESRRNFKDAGIAPPAGYTDIVIQEANLFAEIGDLDRVRDLVEEIRRIDPSEDVEWLEKSTSPCWRDRC